nr:Thymidylate synthase complementing protein [uncultured bacterium]
MQVKLESVTPNPEATMAYIARVSNPSNQDNPDYEKLLGYCIKHQHWSVFEHSTMSVEIETSVAIATQILRHRSFTFQQFSARYAKVSEREIYEARRQHDNNRQLSTDDLDEATKKEFLMAQECLWESATIFYEKMIEKGVAKECARFLLPQMAKTRMYMTGNCRSWIHYIQLRTAEGVQKEHRDIALDIKKIFVEQYPTVSKALGWVESSQGEQK